MNASTRKYLVCSLAFMLGSVICLPAKAQHDGTQIYAFDPTTYEQTGEVVSGRYMQILPNNSSFDLYDSTGNDLGASVHLVNVYTSFWFLADVTPPNNPMYDIPDPMDPTLFPTGNIPTYVTGTLVTKPFEVLAIRFQFDSTNWQSLVPSTATIGLNVINYCTAGQLDYLYPGFFQDYLHAPTNSLYTADYIFFNDPVDKGIGIKEFTNIPGTAQLYSPSCTDSFFTDPYSAYYIYAIEQNYPRPMNQWANLEFNNSQDNYEMFTYNCVFPNVKKNGYYVHYPEYQW